MFTRHSYVRRLLGVGTVLVLLTLLLSASTHIVTASSPTATDQGMALTNVAGLAASNSQTSSLVLILCGETLALTIGIPLFRARFKRRSISGPSSDAKVASPMFANYLQLRQQTRLSLRFWAWARTIMVAAVLACVVVLFAAPGTGLFLFWRLLIPLLPIVFVAAPGVWRNVCPLAASNQTPRLLKITRALTPPAWFKQHSFIIGVAAFFVLASSRKWLFNTNGPATGVLILFALVGAWVGGYLFKGKSGWCTSICPLYPVQRLYNQTPLITVPNAHCTPCVGCTKNCYDFNPGTAYLADLHEDDRRYVNDRKFFAAAMPGFIVAFFTVADPSNFAGVLAMYARFAFYMIISVGAFNCLEAVLRVSTNKLTGLFAAAAFNLFYWFSLPGWLNALGSLLGGTFYSWVASILQAGILGLTVVWIARTYRKEASYDQQFRSSTRSSSAAMPAPLASAQSLPAAPTAITFLPDRTQAPIEIGKTLLEIAENQHQPIEAGCRMGVCGADPVLIVNGMENLPPISDDEKSTLERLGLGPNCRLACLCRVNGPVTVSVDPRAAIPVEQAAPVTASAASAPVTDFDRTIKQVVIIGNGVAGVTAADTVRRNHPACDIHLISREKHHFYNRMGITRLIYGRSAMTGLYMQPEAWYNERNITCWLNTHVTHINRGHKQVALATGETLAYDRLILANGSSSFMPPIPGYGLPGTFVLHDADEAMEIRQYAQAHQCRTAVVAGGGLLGLEAAYALHKLGLSVWVIELGEWLLRRQLDQRAGACLKHYLEALGLIVETNNAVSQIQGDNRIKHVTLKDGRVLPCDVFLVAAGIRPNVELARAAGLDTNRGVLVNEQMRTSAHDIFAAGDVCEFAQQVPGLWPVAADQAKVAAVNAVGGQATYNETVPVTTLKVAGVDMTSIGRFEKQAETEIEIGLEDARDHRYRKLVIAEGKLVGAILLGYPQEAAAITRAVKANLDVRDQLEALRAGHWAGLQDQVARPSPIERAVVETARVIEPPLRERLQAVFGHSQPQPVYAETEQSMLSRIWRSSRR